MTQIRLVALASGKSHPDAGRWLKSWNVDAHGGRGDVVGTDDREEAARFASVNAAYRAWRSQSTVMPLRPDGEPNRPLTAFTVEILDDDVEPLT